MAVDTRAVPLLEHPKTPGYPSHAEPPGAWKTLPGAGPQLPVKGCVRVRVSEKTKLAVRKYDDQDGSTPQGVTLPLELGRSDPIIFA